MSTKAIEALRLAKEYADDEDWSRVVGCIGLALAELEAQGGQAGELLERLRFALGDHERKLSDSQLTRRAHELHQKARKWDEWHEAQNRIEGEMPQGWAFVMQCSPGDWDLYLTDPDGEHVQFDMDCDTTAQCMHAAIDAALQAQQAKESNT